MGRGLLKVKGAGLPDYMYVCVFVGNLNHKRYFAPINQVCWTSLCIKFGEWHLV